MVAEALERGEPGERHGRGLLERDAGGLVHEVAFGADRVLGERSAADLAQHLVADR